MNKSGSGQIDFGEWRDFLLLLPRQASLPAVMSYWQSFPEPRLHTSIATQDLDVLLAEKPPPFTGNSPFSASAAIASSKGKIRALDQDEHSGLSSEGVDVSSLSQSSRDETNGIFDGSGIYLLAGGLAGAVSRTATAPFDRLKVLLINTVHRSGSQLPSISTSIKDTVPAAKTLAGKKGVGAFASAINSLYREGGLHAFFVGNGLNVIKVTFDAIVPSSDRNLMQYADLSRVCGQVLELRIQQTMVC